MKMNGTPAKQVVSAASACGPSCDDPLNITTMRNHPVGTLVYYFLLLFTAFWQILLIVLIADYYEMFQHIFHHHSTSPTSSLQVEEGPYLLGSPSTLAKSFILVWNICVVCLVFLKLLSGTGGGRLRNLFRIKCQPDRAEMVSVDWDLKSEENYDIHTSWLFALVQSMRNRLIRVFRYVYFLISSWALLNPHEFAQA